MRGEEGWEREREGGRERERETETDRERVCVKYKCMNACVFVSV